MAAPMVRSNSSGTALTGVDSQQQQQDVRSRSKTLIKDLQAANQEGKEKCAQKLATFVTHVDDEAPVRAVLLNGGLKPLVQTVESGFDGGQREAAHALAAIAAHGPNYRRQVSAAGAILPLVAVIKSGSNKAAMLAASALAHLTEDPAHSADILKHGALAGLVRMIRLGTADAQAHAATVVGNLSSAIDPNAADALVAAMPYREAQDALSSAGALQLLLALLQVGKTQTAAAFAISRLVAGHEESQRTIAHEGGIPPLLAMLNGAHVPGQVAAASALAEIARENHESQSMIAAAGGIPPLLAMLSGRAPAARAQGARALAEVSRGHPDNQTTIGRMGGLQVLTTLLGSGPEEVQALSSYAVAMISQTHHENQTAVADYGAVSSLVNMLRGQSDTVKAEAAGAIWVLADGHAPNKVAVADAAGIPPVVDLLAVGGLRSQAHASSALASLALDNAENLAQVSISLIGLLGSGVGGEQADARAGGGAKASSGAKTRAAASLTALIGQNATRHAVIADAGSASDLIALLKDGSEEAKSFALWALSRCIKPDNQPTVLAEGGVEPLVAAASSDQAEKVEQAAAALARLALDNAKAQAAVAAADGVKPLVDIVAARPSSAPSSSAAASEKEEGGTSIGMASREFGAAALAELALLPANRDEIVRLDGVKTLVALLNDGSALGKQRVSSALARLARGHDETAELISKAGAIAPLVHLLGGEFGDGCQEEGAHALNALAGEAGNRQLIPQAGGIGPLVALLGSSNTTARTHAEGALVRLSIDAANRVEIIAKLVSMLSDSGIGGEEQAATALANLARDSADNRTSIVSAGGIAPLLGLLQMQSASQDMKMASILAMKNLAYKSKKIQNALAEAGGIPLVVGVLVATTSNAKEMMAAQQLCSLSAEAIAQLTDQNEANQLAANEAGALPPLVSMLGSPSALMQATAAGALAAMTRDNREIQGSVSRTGAIAPLCTLVKEDETTQEVKEQSAAAIWALAMDNKPNKDTIAKLGGMEPLINLLLTGGTQTSHELSIGALSSLAAKHEANREAIAKLLVAKLDSRMAMLGVADGAVRMLSAISLFCLEASANQVAIAKAGGITPLIMWLEGGFEPSKVNVDVQHAATRAMLSLVTINGPLQNLVAKSEGGVSSLIELVGKSGIATQMDAARALWHLASSKTIGKNIANAGGIRPLVALLSVDNVAAQELAAVAVTRLTRCHPSVALMVADHGAVRPLVKLVELGSPAGAQQAADALSELCLMPSHRDLVADVGGIPALVALLTSKVPGTSEVAAKALSRLARSGIKSSSDDQAAEAPAATQAATQAAAASSTAGQDGEGGGGGGGDGGEEAKKGPTNEERSANRRGLIAKVGGVQSMVVMLQAPGFKGRAKKMSDLVNAALDLTAEQHQVGKDGAEVLRGPEVIGVQEQAADALSELAFGDDAMQQTVISEGAVPPLLLLMRNGGPLARENACRCVWHLCGNVDNQGHVVDCGAIVELVTLSRLGSAKAQELAAAVISDLAKGAIIERERLAATAARIASLGAAKAEELPTDGWQRLAHLLRKRQQEQDREEEEAEEKEAAAANGAPAASPSPASAAAADDDEDDDNAPAAGPKDRLSLIAEAGGIVPLVGLVTSGNDMSKERAASALWHLSATRTNQLAVAKAGGIIPLVLLFEDGTDQATEYAADALARLAVDNPENQIAMAKKIVEVIKAKKNGVAQQRAAHMLWELAQRHEGAPERVVNAGAILPLVTLLGTGSTEAKEEAAGGLTCLAEHDPSTQVAISTGLIVLVGSGTVEAQEFVTKMVLKFSDSKANRVALADAGAVERLLMQLSLTPPSETSLHAQTLAAAVLGLLASDLEQNVLDIVKYSGVAPLAKLLGSTDAVAQERAAAVLAAMTTTTRAVQEPVAAEGVVAPLVSLLTSGASLEAMAEASNAIWSLAKGNPSQQEAIVSEGAVEPLVALLTKEHANTQRQAAHALATLATGGEMRDLTPAKRGKRRRASIVRERRASVEEHDAAAALEEVKKKAATTRSSIAAAGATLPLVALLGKEHSDDVHTAAATALAELGRHHAENQLLIAGAAAIEPLVALLDGDHTEACKREVATALWSLSDACTPNQVAIASAGGLAPLVRLIGDSEVVTQQQAAGALAALAFGNKENEEAIAGMTVKLLGSDDKTVSAKAARAIASLARGSPANQEMLARSGGIKPLVSLLIAEKELDKGKADSALQNEVASALWMLAEGNAANEAAVAEEGAIGALITLIEVGSEKAHRNAAGALWSLAASEVTQQLIADEGGIVPLVKLVQKGDPATQETAAGAIHSLAGLSGNRIAIADAGGVPALVALFEVGTDDAKEEAAGALTNMVKQNSVNQSSVAHALVAVLSPVAEDAQESSVAAKEQSVLLIHQLALDPQNRGALAKWGAIARLAEQLQSGTEQSMVASVAALSQIALKSTDTRVQVTSELVLLLGAETEAVRQRASQALKKMSKEGGADSSKMSIEMAGGVERFVSLVQDGSLEAKEYALLVMAHSTDNLSKKSIAMAGCAAIIITVFQTGKLNSIAQENAAALLAGLASAVPGVSAETLASNQAAILDAGGVPPLIKLLRSDEASRSAKGRAASALAQLARGRYGDPQHAIVGAGGVRALVEWLANPSLGPPEEAARAFAAIGANNYAAQLTILEAGAVPHLVGMIEQGQPAVSQQWAAEALATLAEDNPTAQNMISDEGGIEPLVGLLKATERRPQEHATRALCRLAANADNRLAITAAGVLAPLVEIISEDEGSNIVARQQWGAAALEALAHHCIENQIAISKAAAIAPLAALLGGLEEETQAHAKRALLHVSSASAETRVAVIKPLVELLEIRNVEQQKNAAETLAILAARSTANRATIASAGATTPLVQLLGDGRNVSTSQVHAAAALSDLAKTGECKAAIVNAGGVVPLVNMLECKDAQGQDRATQALSHLASYTPTQKLITDAGGIVKLVAKLKSERLATASAAAGTLWHLASHADNKSAMVKAGAIHPLVRLLPPTTESAEAHEAAAAVLSTLAKEKGTSSKATIVKLGGVKSLVALLKGGSVTAQKHAACTLWGVTQEAQFISGVIEAEAVAPLVKLCAVASDAQGFATAALCHLAAESEARRMILEANGPEALTQIASGPATWLRGQAVEILKLMNIPVTVSTESAAARRFQERLASVGGGLLGGSSSGGLGGGGGMASARMLGGTGVASMRNLIEQPAETTTNRGGSPTKPMRRASSQAASKLGSKLKLQLGSKQQQQGASAGSHRAAVGKPTSPKPSPKSSPKAPAASSHRTAGTGGSSTAAAAGGKKAKTDRNRSRA